MRKIEHIILTPFGIGVSDELWVIYRLELLKNIVIPSLQSQTDRNFRWVLMIDKNFSPFLKNKINELKELTSNIEICELNSYSERILFSRSIAASPDSEYMIQSRLDDDDALHVNAVSKIKEAVNKAIDEGCFLGGVGVDGGFDFFCEDNLIAPNHAKNLAIGLSVFYSVNSRAGIFDLKHDDFLCHYSKVGFSTTVKLEPGGYLYTKHPLCDSSYFGMKKRITSSHETKRERPNSAFWLNFGLSERNIENLAAIFSCSPISYPSKAISLSVNNHKASQGNSLLVKKQSSIKMKSLTRERIKKDEVCCLSIGDVANKVMRSLFESSDLSGEMFNFSFQQATETRDVFDIILIDELEIASQVKKNGLDEVNIYLQHIQLNTNYLFIIRWNNCNAHGEYNRCSHVDILLNDLYKAQDIGGWPVDMSVEDKIAKVVVNTKNQLLANI